jgi:hypothetical protein
MISAGHCSSRKWMIECDHDEVMLGGIDKMLGIVVFAHHVNINRHDYRISTIDEGVGDCSVHMFIEIKASHCYLGLSP